MNFIVSCELYPFKALVSFGDSDKKVSKLLKKLDVKDEDIPKASLEGCDGKYVMFRNGISIIRLPEIPKTPYWLGVLSHETLHCVIEVLRSVDLPLCVESEEAYTYLYGYLIQKILEKIQ